MSETKTTKNVPILSEAPASWNTRYITPIGFVCQLTLRGENGRDLLEKANSAMEWLLENDFKPVENGTNHSQNGHSSDGISKDPAVVCPIHQVEMRKWEKNGNVWFSHKVDGNWCTGKQK
jgi:hypothetical protein